MKKTQVNRQRLLDVLKQRHKLGISDVVQLLGISEATARRLFTQLEQEGKLIRTHGGIRPAGNTYLYEEVELEGISEKTLIGIYAAGLVKRGSVVYIDSGTTTAQLCHALARRFERRELCDITIFTNSLVILNILSDFCPIHLIGGEYRPQRRDFCGYLAESAVCGLHFSQCFLGSDGFDEKVLFMATDFQTARLNELVLGRSDSRCILADSRKFLRPSLVGYCGGEGFGIVVVTNHCPPDTAGLLINCGAEIFTATPDQFDKSTT